MGIIKQFAAMLEPYRIAQGPDPGHFVVACFLGTLNTGLLIFLADEITGIRSNTGSGLHWIVALLLTLQI